MPCAFSSLTSSAASALVAAASALPSMILAPMIVPSFKYTFCPPGRAKRCRVLHQQRLSPCCKAFVYSFGVSISSISTSFRSRSASRAFIASVALTNSAWGAFAGSVSGGKAIPRLGLLLDVLHGQRDGQLLALGIAQTNHHQHRGHNDRADGDELAGAQPRVADEQRVGAQPLDQARPRPYQMM